MPGGVLYQGKSIQITRSCVTIGPFCIAVRAIASVDTEIVHPWYLPWWLSDPIWRMTIMGSHGIGRIAVFRDEESFNRAREALYAAMDGHAAPASITNILVMNNSGPTARSVRVNRTSSTRSR